MRLLIINVTQHMPQNRVSDTKHTKHHKRCSAIIQSPLCKSNREKLENTKIGLNNSHIPYIVGWPCHARDAQASEAHSEDATSPEMALMTGWPGRWRVPHCHDGNAQAYIHTYIHTYKHNLAWHLHGHTAGDSWHSSKIIHPRYRGWSGSNKKKPPYGVEGRFIRMWCH